MWLAVISSKSASFNPLSNALSLIAMKGVGMVEILVTLFILTVGLLGVASLQFVSAFSNADALHRSQAVLVAQQFSERLRAAAAPSVTGAGLVVDNQYYADDVYNFADLSCDSSALPYECFCLAIPASVPNCQQNQCNAAQFAQFDTYEVSCAVTSAAPSLLISLTCADNNVLDTDRCSAGARQQIMVTWPVENWQNQQRILNPECNTNKDSPHDCVTLDLTL
ncbi:type IV pilus assembly protein PilV [Paraglaciecola polaris LMG 21857]|uniref:Type IV pilus assembly protein PilV n=2 Tax=Paraglaciecola polaris TaxID=222814 RepID=K6ZXP8_9ALTE|nr:type IV pilus assembly protein PilV [Paraglaciecola polaris LMG 21857]